MIIGVLELDLDIPAAYSLKDKRMVLNRIRDRVRQTFNVAFAEVDQHEVWNHATLGIVTLSTEKRHANQMLSKIVTFIETLPDCSVEDVTMEFI